jgi:hypothetical protein
VNGWTVTYGRNFLEAAAARFPVDDRGQHGATFGEFMTGPVRAARLLFSTRWDQQLAEAGESVRTVHIFSPTLGPVVFFGVLVAPQNVEIAGFDFDPDYWTMIEGDPE